MTKVILPVLFLIVAAGCNLAGAVTPPPGLAPLESPDLVRPSPIPTSNEPDLSEPILNLDTPSSSFDLGEGEVIYAEKCAACHGDFGMGDGSMSENLEIAPTAIGATEFGRSAIPAEWYEIVTAGRINRFMPPFLSLTDAERWNVVGYALSLSVPQADLDRGEMIYSEFCSDCHGEHGDTEQNGIRLSNTSWMATKSLGDIVGVISTGQGTMPAFSEVVKIEDQWALSTYVRSLASDGEPGRVLDTTQAVDETYGTILGSAIYGMGTEQGTPSSIADLEVVLLGFDGDTPVLTETTTTDTEGAFEFSNLEIVPGRIFGAFIEYDGARYYSTAAHFMEETPIIELPIILFDSTTDRQDLEVERLHLVLDYSVEGLVEISELWLITNSGLKTIVSEEGAPWLEIPLPDGFENFHIADSSVPVGLDPSGTRVILEEPVLPGETIDLVFSVNFPYERQLDFVQELTEPVGAIVALTAEEAPQIIGEGLEETGIRDMGGARFRTYAIEPPAAGDRLTMNISGRHPTAPEFLDSQNLVIALGILGLAIVLVGIGWWYFGSREEETDDVAEVPSPTSDKQALLHAMAALDDAFESGEIPEEEYQARRSDLKRELSELMKNERD